MKHKRSGSLEQLQGEMCSNLYSEALALAGTTFSDNIPTFRDLLLEMGKLMTRLFSQLIYEKKSVIIFH